MLKQAFTVPPPAQPRPHLQERHYATPSPPPPTHPEPFYGRCAKSWRGPSQADRCLGQSNAEISLFDRPGLSTFWRNDNNPAPTSTRAPPTSCSSNARSPASGARTLRPSLLAPPADRACATLPSGFSPSQKQRRSGPEAGAPPRAPDRGRRTPAHGGQHQAVATCSGRDHRGTLAWLLLATLPLQLTAATSTRPSVAAGLVSFVLQLSL